MAIELITGRAGEPHVDSADVGALNAALFGAGAYVLEGIEAELVDANNVLITAGEMLCEGRHVRITGEGETLTIENGLSAYKRHDIVAAHYLRGEDGIESVTLVVIKGSNSSTSPQDPPMPRQGKVIDGASEAYWPLYRIVVDGLTPQTPAFIAQRQALYQLGIGIEIPTGADLNDYTTPGVYKTINSSVSSSLKNNPMMSGSMNAGCTLLVELGGGGNNVLQTITNNFSGLTFTRRKVSGTWESWSSNLSFTRFWASEKRNITDMLLVGISGSSKTADVNMPSFINVANASTLTNLPPFFSGYNKDFIAIRTVDWLQENRVLVTLHELYPEHGRVWTNHYNWTSWAGWRCTSGLDSIVAEGTTNNWVWKKYANGTFLAHYSKTTSIPATSANSTATITVALPFTVASAHFKTANVQSFKPYGLYMSGTNIVVLLTNRYSNVATTTTTTGNPFEICLAGTWK